MLAGGPGDAPSFNARFFSRVFHDIRRTRDIVLVDLRGTGKSAPLFCPELGQPGSNGIFDANLLSVRPCARAGTRLEKTADLRLYTTEIAVDDLEEVRQRARLRADQSLRHFVWHRASRRSTCDAIPPACARCR